MILVDTNVWSESTRPSPDERVAHWARLNGSRLWLSAVVLGELRSGIALMAEGRRRELLGDQIEAIANQYADRVLPFDVAATQYYADVIAIRSKAGRTVETADAQIAATALAHGMMLATRNVAHFDGVGLTLIDPWAA